MGVLRKVTSCVPSSRLTVVSTLMLDRHVTPWGTTKISVNVALTEGYEGGCVHWVDSESIAKTNEKRLNWPRLTKDGLEHSKRVHEKCVCDYKRCMSCEVCECERVRCVRPHFKSSSNSSGRVRRGGEWEHSRKYIFGFSTSLHVVERWLIT